MATSRILMNFHEESEALLNKRINMEFYTSYVYLGPPVLRLMIKLSMAFLDILMGAARRGGPRDQGMEYQVELGGRIVFQDIASWSP
jgi:hypothetical protein